MNVGDAVLLRSIYRGNVRWCFSHYYVGEWEGRHGLYCGPGSPGKGNGTQRPAHRRYLEYGLLSTTPLVDRVWDRTNVLRFMREGDAHTVEVFWDEEWELLGWYVNLQAPLVVRGDRFDTTDWALDVWVEPDGSWSWKDEDEFAQAQELGIFDAVAAAEVRAEGERVIADRPWPTGWEDWRPPPEWEPLALPIGWDVI